MEIGRIINSTNPGSGYQPSQVSAGKQAQIQAQAEVKVETPKAKAAEQAQTNSQIDAKSVENARLETIRAAAAVVAKDVFVVSDVRFTIFKDVAGQYITRFTSLRDGSVKYYPEVDLLDMTKSGGGLSNIITTEA